MNSGVNIPLIVWIQAQECRANDKPSTYRLLIAGRVKHAPPPWWAPSSWPGNHIICLYVHEDNGVRLLEVEWWETHAHLGDP